MIVKEDNEQLPADRCYTIGRRIAHRNSKMREERQMLGQMISQVHQQQTELKELQNQITEKLDTHNQSLLAIQNSQEAIQTAQKSNLNTLKII